MNIIVEHYLKCYEQVQWDDYKVGLIQGPGFC